MTQTPQPQSAEERLREKIMDALVVSVLKDGGIQKASLDTVDAIMQAVTAEIGAARIDEVTKAIAKIRNFMAGTANDPAANAILELLDHESELRNHFGIGEAQA